MALTISTVRNAAVSLLATDTPVTITPSGTVLETGTLSALGGPAIVNPWVIGNQGLLQSAQGEGVLLFSGGTITNGGTANAAATIIGGLQGVELGGPAQVVNYGSIAALVQFGVWFGAGGSLANGDDTHAQARVTGGGTGVLVAGGAGSIVNGGQIQGTAGSAISLFAGGSVTNGSTANAAAMLSGGVDGIHAYTVAATVANAGTIIGTAASGIELEAGGTIANSGTAALVSGGSFGALLLGTGQVANQGTVVAAAAGGLATWIGADGTITNGGTANAAARMQGGTFGAIISGSGTVANYGSLIGDATFGVWIADNGAVANTGSAALLSGGNVGAIVSGATGTIDNTGTIQGGTLFGAWMAGQGTVHNGQDGGAAMIEGAGNGLVVGGTGTVDNRGTILGDGSFGLWLSSGGTLQNGSAANSQAMLGGGQLGLLVTGAAGQLMNYGTIVSPGLIGAAVQAGGTFTNGSRATAGALVSGGSFGALLAGAGTEFFNYGTVRGAYAVYAGDSGAPETVHNGGGLISPLGAAGYALFFATAGNTLDVQPGASFIGKVELGGGVLKASGGSVAISGLGGQIHGFTTLAVDPVAVLNLSGANTLAAGATLAAGSHVALAGAATLDLQGTLAGGGATDVFTLGASARLLLAGTGGGSFAPEIDNFAAGNRIDIGGLSPNGAVTAAPGAGNSIVLSDQSGTLFTLGNVHFAAGDAPGLVAGVEAGKVFLAASPAGADVVIQWDGIARATITNDASAPPVAARAMAIESLAVYDTMQAILGLSGFSVTMAAPVGISHDAALASAAASVLKALYPAQAGKFDALLSASLAGVAEGQAKTDGIAFGQAVAAKELALRANDGSADFTVHAGGNAVGQWRPTAPALMPAADPQYANVRPFALTSPGQFAPGSIPALDSQAYADAVNQVQSLGARDSATRTADQTQIAKFWNDQTGTDTPPGQWNQIAATVATQFGLTLAADARLFAMLNVALADAGISAWHTKFAYDTWRPISAIQLGGTGNPALTADPGWQPLLTTPNFPEYVAGHGAFSGAAAAVLANVFGDGTHFSATSQSTPGVTRSFTSFSEAALEASMSRVYGGIHYEFSVMAGYTLGGEVADWTLAQFGDGVTPGPPRIVLSGASGRSSATNPTIAGQVIGVAGTTLEVSFDGGGSWNAVTLDATGQFQVQPAYPTDGTQDGAHAIYFRATDPATHAGEASFGFVLASQGPSILLDAASLQDNGTLTAASVLSGTVTPALDSSIVSLTYALDGGAAMPVSFDPATHGFATGIDLFAAAAGGHTIVLTATDAAGNATPLTLHETLAQAVPFRVASLTPTAYETDIGVTYRPMVTFTRAVDPATLTADSFYITDSAGARIAASIAPLAGGKGAWLLPTGAMPGGTTLTLHLDAALILAADGTPLDISGTQASGTELLDPFTTVATAIVPGTSITGLVVDPGPDNTALTPDDVSNPTGSSANFPLNTWKLPLAGVRVFILGHEADAVLTDATGHFTLTNVPAGDVKLAIDGRTATNAAAGFFFPEMVYDLDVIPGVANSVGSALGAQGVRAAQQDNPSVYLPRIPLDAMTPLGASQPTVVHAPADAAGASGMTLTQDQLARLTITVMPGSLLDADGNPVQNATVGISPVPSSLVKDMLPPGLEQHTFDITIQTPGGAVLTQPATLSFPNVFGLLPGQKTYMISFNHTTGLLEVDGTGTASADGLTITTDPGSGVTQPGWHGYTDPKSRGKTRVVVKNPQTGLKEVVYLDAQEAQANLTDTASFWASRSGDLNNVVNGTELGARQFEHQFAKNVAQQAGRFAPIGLGIDGVVLANDTGNLYKDLNTANNSGSLVDGLAVVEDGVKVMLDTAITGLDYATLGGVATAETGVGAVEAVAAQGLKDVLNMVGIGLSVADYGLQFGGDYVARHFDNAGNSNADILGPKFDPDLVLRVSGDAWGGSAMITVSIDGVQVLGPTAITALHSLGQTQLITVSGILGDQAHTVKVTLVNGASGDGLDEQRNAYIQSANFNGQEFAFSTPLYGAALTPASATFSVGSVITRAQVAVDTAAQTNQNEFAFQQAIRTRQLAHLNAMLPVHEHYNPALPDNGLTATEVQGYLVDIKAFADEAALLGGHAQTGTLISNLANAVSTGISALYGSTFAAYNGPPVDLPPLSQLQAAARDAAFAAGQPYTQTWESFSGASAGAAPGTVVAPTQRSYTWYPPGSGQEPLGTASFGLLTAADGTQERFSFDPAKGIDRLLTPNTFYRLDAFDPRTGAGGTVVFTTAASGTDTIIPDLPYINDGSPKLADGLTAFQANIIGVDPTIASNLVPGLTDLAALQQGLFNTVKLPTASGIQAALGLNGEAKAIALAGTAGAAGSGRTLALLATGSYGMAVVDITQPLKPALLAQLALPGGSATDIALDAQRQVAAVADGNGGLALVSYADPGNPALLAQVGGQYSHVVAFAGAAYASSGGSVQAFDIVTGDLLAVLDGAPGAITGLAIDHGVLYTMDSSHTLRAISLANGGLALIGSLALPGGGNGLVVGNGVATVPTGDGAGNGGYLTVDVTDPSNPALIAGAANLGNAGDAVALNGSGLGLFAGQIQVFGVGLQPELDVVDTSSPLDTGARTQRFLLPAAAGGVAISGGLGFVADGTAGLQVVRYRAFTPNAVAPTVTITSPPADADPSTPGTQAVEGSSVGLDVAIASPGQILSVDVLLNGHAVLTDLQYPFDLGLTLPTIAANAGTDVSLEVRATDTNGNVTTAAPIALQLVADTAPPVLVSASLVDGGVISTATHLVRFVFNKPLDAGSATAGNFALRVQGGATITPVSVALGGGGRVVELVYPDLAVGSYSFTLNAPGVLSAAGIALGATPQLLDFAVQAFTKTWAKTTGGDWNVAGNWDATGIPGPTDGVFIGTRLPVTIAAASSAGLLVDRAGEIDITAGRLTVTTEADLANGALKMLGGTFEPDGVAAIGRLTLSAGALEGTGTITVNNNLSFTGGTLAGIGRTIVGPNAAAAIAGTANIAGFLDVAGTASLSGNIALAAGTLGVLAGGTLQLAGTLSRGVAGGQLANAGTVAAAGGVLASLRVENAGGTLLAADGTQLGLQSAVIAGGTLATLGSGAIRAIDRGSLLQGSAVANGATVTVTNNNGLSVSGTIANAGTINLASIGNYTALLVSGGATLAGAGSVAMSDNTENRITSNGAPATLTNAQTILGGGRLGDGDPNLTVLNTGTINASAANPLLINLPQALVNQGLIEGTGGGAMTIQSTTVDGSGNGNAGRIFAAAGGRVDLQTASLIGGTLDTAPGGTIRTVDRGTALQSLAIAPGANVVVTNNNFITFGGTIANAGTIAMASVGNYTALRATGAAVLAGAGAVVMGDSTENRITASGAAATLLNQQTIMGGGRIGDGDPLLAFTNDGTVNASVASQIIVNLPAGLANHGLLEGTGGGGMLLQSTTVDGAGGGVVQAGDGSRVDLQSATIAGGTLATLGSGLIRAIDRTSVLNGATIAAGATVQVTNNNFLAIAGTIANAGTITLTSIGNYTALQAIGATRLQGAGAIVFSDNTENRLTANGAAATIDLMQPLRGAGRIGDSDPLLTIRNFSTISATGANQLIVTAPTTIVNNGVMEGIGSGGLRIQSATIDGHGGGVIQAVGAGAHVDLVSATIDGGALLASGGGVIQAIDRGSVLRGAGLVAGSTLLVTNNNILTLQDALSTGATITLASGGNYTALAIDGAVTLQPGGVVQLTDSTENRIIGGTGATLVNAGTIEGAGRLGDGAATLAVTNAGAGTILADAGAGMTVNFAGGTLANAGQITATGGGALTIQSTTIDGRTGGTVRADGAAARVDLYSATILGGTLIATAGGTIRTIDRGSLLDGAAIAAGTTVTDTNNNYLTLAGTIANQGTLLLSSVGNDTALVAHGTVTLSGAGQVVLSDNGANRLIADGAPATLRLLQPLSGGGAIGSGDGNFTLVNLSTMTANGGSALTFSTPNTVTNAGTLEATNTGGLVIQSTAVDSSGGGVIRAVGAGAHVDLRSATITGGGLFGTGGGVIQAVDRGSLLHGADLAPGSALTIVNNNALTLADGLAAGATISLASIGNYTALLVAGGVTLAAGSAVLMGDNGENRIAGGAGAALLNLGTIAGSGHIGDGAATMTVANGAGGVIAASQPSTLRIDLAGGGIANSGTIRADAGGALLVLSSLIAQSGGTLLASGAGAHVDLQSAAISGGTVATALGGAINVVDRGSSLADLAIAPGSTVSLANNQFLRLDGNIANAGTIALTSIGNDTALLVTDTVNLTGPGALTATDNPANRIGSDGAAATLVNAQTIAGALRIGNGDLNLTFVNDGTLTAIGGSGMVVNTPAAEVVNNGTMEAAAGSLTVSGAMLNAGLVTASGGPVFLAGPVTGTGQELLSGAASFEFGGSVAAGQTVTFAAGSTATLRLDQAGSFAGTIAGLAFDGTNAIDLISLGFLGGSTSASFTGTTSGGTLQVTSGSATVNLLLAGNYATAGFATANDGAGHTLVTVLHA